MVTFFLRRNRFLMTGIFASWCATAFLPSGREHEAKGVQRVDVWGQGSRGVIRKRRDPRQRKVWDVAEGVLELTLSVSFPCVLSTSCCPS